MPKRTSNSPAGKSVLAILLITMLGAGVLAGYVHFSPQAAHVTVDQRSSEPDVTIRSTPSRAVPIEKSSQHLSLFVPTVVSNDVSLSKPAADAQEGVRPEVDLVNQTLQSLQIEGARAVGLDLQGHVAKVDFNSAIQKGYGTIEEGYLIKALQMALGQFPEISKFQIVVEGKAIDSLGNIDLSAPIDVIRPGAVKSTIDSDDTTHPNPS